MMLTGPTMRDSSREPALELVGINLSYGALVALKEINFSLQAGERRAVLGSNGAGKTTLLNVVTGELTPSGGRIRFFGEDITRKPAYRRIRSGLRRTYQISQLFRGLRVLDAVYLCCRGVSNGGRFSPLRPRRQDPLMQQAERILDQVLLRDSKYVPTAQLSHGQQRQLEIGLALVGAPRFILFDEPAAGLSPAERRTLVAVLSSLPPHVGYIIIEHDLDVALRVSSLATMMHNGRVLLTATPSEFEKHPLVHEIYTGLAHG